MARGENKEQNEIVAHMKNFETVSNLDIKFDESFNIKIDCNNDIGIMYLLKSGQNMLFEEQR